MFSKILIANRSEIAVRIIRACKEMGISTVAVHSDVDKESLHVSLADESVCIGGAFASESYLRVQDIIAAAKYTGSQAVHPGYGFLAENADFARACKENGLVFIGPDADVIAAMGDKDAARKKMKAAGVPTVPGSEILENANEAKRIASEVGYPVLIKARAGGGGKGIRLVISSDEMEKAFLTASEEAKNAFGDGKVYLEKYLSLVKHIEVQILADEQGTVLCLGERECSVQQKNQKLLEESPCAAISQQLREEMYEAARKAATAAGYVNAGTIEFLLDQEKNFYFMEMNTRLQVEHPVTEYVCGLDIVKWQIRIAAGVLLQMRQQDLQLKGSAIECRINALGTGDVSFLHVPGGPWVRFDTFLYQGYKMLPYYDSMMGKLIVYASGREEAIRKMNSALCELVIDGIPNNVEQQLEIISDPEFIAGTYSTDFMRKRGD